MHPNPNRQLDLRKFAIYGICYLQTSFRQFPPCKNLLTPH